MNPRHAGRSTAEAMKRAVADTRPERLAQYREESLARAKPLLGRRQRPEIEADAGPLLRNYLRNFPEADGNRFGLQIGPYRIGMTLRFDVSVEDTRLHLAVPFDLHEQPVVAGLGKPVRKGDFAVHLRFVHSWLLRVVVAFTLLFQKH